MPNEESGDGKPFWLARSTRTIFFFAVMLTMGASSARLPAEPKNVAVPKVKTPPSDATSQ